MSENPPTAEELQELLNGEDFYELLRKTPDSETKAYIDKIWMNAIYGKLDDKKVKQQKKNGESIVRQRNLTQINLLIKDTSE